MNLLKRPHWILFNAAAWLTLLLTYVLPYRTNDEMKTTYGYPFVFLTSFNGNIARTPLMSMAFNPGVLIVNIIIVYIILANIINFLDRIKKRNQKDSY